MALALEFAEPSVLPFGELSDVCQEGVMHLLEGEQSLQMPCDEAVFESEPVQPFPTHARLVVEGTDLVDQPRVQPCVQPDGDAFADFGAGELGSQDDGVGERGRGCSVFDASCDFDGADDASVLGGVGACNQFR